MIRNMQQEFIKKNKIYDFFTILIFLFSGCDNAVKITTDSKEFFAMDTFMKLTATGKNVEVVLEESYELIENIESVISRTDVESDIYRLNHSQGEVVTVCQINYCLK